MGMQVPSSARRKILPEIRILACRVESLVVRGPARNLLDMTRSARCVCVRNVSNYPELERFDPKSQPGQRAGRLLSRQRARTAHSKSMGSVSLVFRVMRHRIQTDRQTRWPQHVRETVKDGGRPTMLADRPEYCLPTLLTGLSSARCALDSLVGGASGRACGVR